MKIIMFCHPEFMASQSMPRFARMLEAAYGARGHDVTSWSPQPKLYKYFAKNRFAKWAGYVDQYILFPLQVHRKIRSVPSDTLFVFCDQAQGPWVPLVKGRQSVVHVHDLLALRSALHEIPENRTSFSGRLYQRYIRRGFRQSKNFISTSKQSQADLHRVGRITPLTSEVVYNGLNYPYAPIPKPSAFKILTDAGLPAPAEGMLLHVGGDQWYKNRRGLISLYSAYAARDSRPLPLWCIGPKPDAKLRAVLTRISPPAQVLFFQNLDNRTLQAAYSYARAFLFPSLAEGFGWPLVEAQACGCPVVTTDDPPMNEVAGEAAYYLPRLEKGGDLAAWGAHAAEVLRALLALDPEARAALIQRGLRQAKQFDADKAISGYLKIYESLLNPRTSDAAAGMDLRKEHHT